MFSSINKKHQTQQPRVQTQNNDYDGDEEDDDDDDGVVFSLCVQPCETPSPWKPNYYQNLPIYATKRKREHPAPFSHEGFLLHNGTVSISGVQRSIFATRTGNWSFHPIWITNCGTLEVMQASYYTFKMLLLFFFLFYWEILKFQTKYIAQNYLNAWHSTNVMHAQVVIYLSVTDSSDITAANIFI